MALCIALIGFGTGGAVFHAPLIAAAPELTLSAVVTANPQRQQAVRDRYPGAAVLTEVGQVWEAAGSYDLAVVTTPNRTHVPLARDALHAGLPVIVDKPVAVTAAEARELAALADRRGHPVIPFHNRRWDSDFRTVRRLLDDGALGRVRRLESRFERWRPEIKQGWKESADPREGGGILYDLGPHLIDQAVALFGPPEHVYAELDTRRPGALAHDDAFLALTHPGGVRCHLWMSAVAADLGPRFRVLGERGSYVVSGMDGQEDALRAGKTPSDPGWGASAPESYGRVGTPEANHPIPTELGAYQDFYAEVVRCLKGEAPPPVTLRDAVVCLEIIEAALRQA